MGLSERLEYATTWKVAVGAALCVTPLLPVGVGLLVHEYLKTGERMDDAGGEAA